GSLKKEQFNKIWSTAPLLKWIRSKTISDLKECKDCDLASYCCRCCALAYWEKNDLLGSAPSCCRQAKALKEVIEDERKETKEKIPETEDDREENYCALL
ncbi:MAG: hypothetical protein KAS87_00070, partial [Candidatus Omnitrophica bacterium]|nr:hypothetical protein [Candidatus Omnitrophota bacterium]